MEELTPRQRQILNVVREFIATSGFPPTRSDICRAMGFSSPNAAQEHLRTLERKGMIEMLEGASRGIRLTKHTGVPLVGNVAAGSPLLAVENVKTHLQLDPQLFKPHADYLLRVRGMSMRDAGILDGDMVAVHRAREARSGQVVVARIGDEVTVKRFQRAGERVKLLAENPDFEPIEVDLRRETLEIEGVVVGVIRDRAI